MYVFKPLLGKHSIQILPDMIAQRIGIDPGMQCDDLHDNKNYQS
jgi:hypothetical protein